MKLTTFLFLALSLTATAQSLYFADHPTLTPNGETTIFSYDSDLWSVPTAGGTATRLTAMDGTETRPAVSPDGQWLAFSSNQYGNHDVYLMPMTGGRVTQLTFHDGNDEVESWGWDSKTIYFTSNRYDRMNTYTVDVTGSTPRQLFDHYFAYVHNAVPHPVTGALYYNESWESKQFTSRKGYRGPFNPEIRSFDKTLTTATTHTDWEGKDMWPTIDRTGNVYFASDRGGREYNLFQLTDGEPQQLTDLESSVYNPSVAANGSGIVYVRDYQLHYFDLKTQKESKIRAYHSDFETIRKTQDFNLKDGITGFDVTPDGKKLAVISRGGLFVSGKEGKFVRTMNTLASRTGEVHWLKNGETMLFNLSGGYQNWYVARATSPNLIEPLTKDLTNNRNLSFNSDTTKAVYLSGRNEIKLMDLKTFKSETIASDELWGLYNDIPQWSPDDRYVMYTAMRDFENDIFLIDMENDYEVTNLTRTGVSESGPVWSPDGKYIYFQSARHQPGYPRGGGELNLYRLPLRVAPKPFVSNAFDELFEKDTTEADNAVTIDFERIMERIETVGKTFGSQGGVAVRQQKGKTQVFYGSTHEGGKGKLYVTTYEDFEDPKTKAVDISVGGMSDLVTTEDGTHYFVAENGLQKLTADLSKVEKVKYDHTFRRNLRSEFEQMFYETWANVEENFYDGDFHGIDWTKTRDRYAEYLSRLNNRDDLRRLINDMLGELNTSHYGFRSSGKEEKTEYRARTQGPGLRFSKTDPYVVAEIITDGPLDHYGAKVKVGDRLIEVNGVYASEQANRERYFSQPSMDEEMTLRFMRGDGLQFDQKLHPVSSGRLRTLRYDEWMHDNQRRVDSLSDKRIAYIHMKNMTGGELDRFLNEMVSETYNRDALILDLRYNTGGNVHNDVLQFLSQRPYMQWKYRGGKLADQPNFTPAVKPIVLLTNEQSLSDAEMTAEGFKQLGLGTAMGMPTYRWIIFTTGKGLVDGSFYRLPSWGCYTLDGRNLEKTGVEPDVVVPMTATDRQGGKDPQLDRAVAEILGKL